MGIEEILGEKREEIHRIAAKHGVTSIRIFGSVARGEAGPDSDVDFLIEAGDANACRCMSRCPGSDSDPRGASMEESVEQRQSLRATSE